MRHLVDFGGTPLGTAALRPLLPCALAFAIAACSSASDPEEWGPDSGETSGGETSFTPVDVESPGGSPGGSPDASPGEAPVETPAETPWGEYGPFDDLAEAALETYDGVREPAVLDATTSAELLDALIFGPFADGTVGDEDGSGRARRDSALDRFDERLERSAPPPDRPRDDATARCPAGGEAESAVRVFERDGRTVRLETIDHEACDDGRTVLDGRIVVVDSLGTTTDDAVAAWERTRLIGLDGVTFTAGEHRLELLGAERQVSTSAPRDLDCVAERSRTSTLRVRAASTGESVLLDDLRLESYPGGDCLAPSAARSAWTAAEGRLLHSRHGAVDVTFDEPLSHYPGPSALESVSSPHAPPEDTADDGGGLRLDGAIGSHVEFAYRTVRPRGPAATPVRVAELLVVPDDLPAERFRFTEADFLAGAMADLDDADDDGLPDGWEREHGLDPLDAEDAGEDGDGDGATALEEYRSLSDPRTFEHADDAGATVDESIALALTNTVDPDSGEMRVRVDVSIAYAARGAPLEATSYSVTLRGDDVRWSEPLPAGCRALDAGAGVGAAGSSSTSAVRCRHEYPYPPSDDAEREHFAEPLFVEPSADTALVVEARLDGAHGKRADGTAFERTPEDNVREDELAVVLDPPRDFRVEAPALLHGNADETRTLVATVTQTEPAPPAPLELRVDVPAGIVVQGATLLADRAPDEAPSCTVGADVVCTMDAVRHTDELRLELEYHAVGEGVHSMRLEAGTDAPERDAANDVAVTRIERVSSVAPLQALIDAAEDGDTVTLPPGRYDGTLDGRGLRIEVRGAAAPERTTLVSVDPNRPLLEHLGSRSHWRELELRSSGAPIVHRAEPNVTLAESLIAPVDGVAHAMDALVRTARGYRLRGNRIEGWGRGEGSVCTRLLGNERGTDVHGSPVYLEDNLVVDNDCETMLRATLPAGERAHYHASGNTIVGIPRPFVLEAEESESPYAFDGYEASFRNNIVVGADTPLEIDAAALGRSGAAAIVIASNLVGDGARPSLATSELLTHVAVEQERADLHADPSFVDAPSGDYRLAADSPAIDAGSTPEPYRWWWWFDQDASVQPTVDDSRVPLDGDGDGRAEHDIGAFERAP